MRRRAPRKTIGLPPTTAVGEEARRPTPARTPRRRGRLAVPAAVLVPPKTAKTSRLGPAPRRTLKRPSSSVVTVVARRCSAAPGSNRSITVSDRPPGWRVRAHRQAPAERRARSVVDGPALRQQPESVAEARDQRRPRLERVGQHHRGAVRPPRGGARVAGGVVAGHPEFVLADRIVLRAPAAEQGVAGAEGRQRLVGIGRAGGAHGDLAAARVRPGERVRDPRFDQLGILRVRGAGEDDRGRLAVDSQRHGRRRGVLLPVRVGAVVHVARRVARVVGDRVDAGRDHGRRSPSRRARRSAARRRPGSP